MANEIMVTESLTVRKGSVTRTYSGNFTTDLDAANAGGPTPGALVVPEAGVDIDFTELTAIGGMCWMQNNDEDNYVEYGVWDGANFFPLGELLAGEKQRLRLSRRLLTGDSGTASVNSLRFYAFGGPAEVEVSAYNA